STPYKVCELKIIVDYNFYNIYCGKSIKRAVQEVAYAVSITDDIFRNIDFDFDGIADNIGFSIKEIMIFENDSSRNYYLGQERDAKTVLKAFTRYDFSKLCLGILMTYRDLTDGVIGLAFTSSSSKYGSAGGICQRRSYSRKSVRSLNTLLVTPINFGKLIPRRMFALTLAHEMGHAFGSLHDPEGKICLPEGRYGWYLMSAKTHHFTRPNNKKFSPCSVMSMGPVVANKASCLKVYDGYSLCGNYLVDPGEECDCGPTAETCDKFDPCCVAPSHSKPGCRVARELDKHCSPRMSPCCTHDCKVEPNPVLCRASTECSHESMCDTASVECPDSAPLADGTLCRDGTRVCRRGECDVSRCTHHGWEDCQCRTKEEDLCELCCKPRNATQTGCISAYKLADDDDIVGPIYRQEGDLCHDNTGYCNEQHRCNIIRLRDYDDAFSLIFQLSANDRMTEWGQNYWYLMFIGVVSLTCIFNFLR
ncbi:Disintegrin and metalloproteinase domain-containing protein 10, partial [Lamellibrachia satsuma]